MKPKNIVQCFIHNAEKLGEKPCFKYKKGDHWEELSWADAEVVVRDVALGLKALGCEAGHTVALFSNTRMEWTVCDLAILSIGAVSVPIYQSNTADQAAYIIQNSGAQIVIVENKSMYDRIMSEKANLPELKKIIVIAKGVSKKEEDVLSFDDLQKLGREGDDVLWKKGIQAIDPKSLATIVYTSGTTGPPKGAMLTHESFLGEAEACERLFQNEQGDVSIVFLPLAHILARDMQLVQIKVGFTQVYAESIDKLIDNIGEVKPHFFAGVPRIFEKVYEKMMQKVEEGSPLKKAVFSWAKAIGSEISLAKQHKKPIGLLLKLQGALANALVFGKLQERLGGRLRFAVSGGAPLAKEIAEFFHIAGVMLLEGYGLTETTGAITCNTTEHYKFGSVGRAVHGNQIKIAADGEILAKGVSVFKGYYKNPEATQEVLTKEGWFKTGDIGELDSHGYLRITDRKKDIIVTAGGKNIAPQNIENLIKTVPMISQVMVHGDKRKYLTALITLNKEIVEDQAKKMGISFSDYPDLVKSPQIYKLVKQAVEEKNKIMASFESVKKFAILENDFTQETGELTPTLKVKRKFVNEKYKNVIDSLYQEN